MIHFTSSCQLPAFKKLAKQASLLFLSKHDIFSIFRTNRCDSCTPSTYLPTKNWSLSRNTWNAPFTKNVIELLQLCIILAEIFSFWTSFHVWQIFLLATSPMSYEPFDTFCVRILPGKRKKYQIRERKCNIFHFRPLITQQSWNVLTTCCCCKNIKRKKMFL